MILLNLQDQKNLVVKVSGKGKTMKKCYSISQTHAFFRGTGVESSCSFGSVDADNFHEAVIEVMKRVGNSKYFEDKRIDIEEKD